MKINVGKTSVMTIDDEKNMRIEISMKEIDHVVSYR